MPDFPETPGLGVELSDLGVLSLTLDRQPLNLLTQELRHALGSCLGAVARRSDIRAVLLSGGETAFCAGADMKEFAQRFERGTARAHGANGHRMMRNLVRCPVPVIAAVEGPCLGGGYELALGCDWIIAAQGARVGLPELGRGIFPGTAGIPCLERRIGLHAARMFVLMGATAEGDDALRRGLVDELVPVGQALSTASAVADRLATSPAEAVRAIKRLSDHDFLERFDRHLMAEIDAFEDIFQTADAREGCAAFFDKRSPRWVPRRKGSST